jgi:type 2 lantibiotic biosynthesis protein LanM
VARAEIAALERRDVPIFRVATDGTDLVLDSGGTIPRLFRESGDRAARARALALDAEGIRVQADVACAAIAVVRASIARPAPRPFGGTVANDDQLLEEADAIGRTLEATHRPWTEGHGVTWMGLAPIEGADPRTARIGVRDIGHGSYAGRCGVALFLGALARASGEGRYRDLAERAVLPTLLSFRERRLRETWVQHAGLGVASGVGGAIHGLVTAGASLSHPEWLLVARDLAAAVTPAQLEADRNLDLMSGAAGYLLALLALYRATGAADVLERAEVCGRHLLRARVQDVSSGHRVWVTAVGRRPTTGVPHGSAGIAFALAQLYRAAGGEDFLAAVAEAQAFERDLYVPARSNWRESSDEHGADSWCSWCHGAAGIGLARLGCVDVLPEARLRADVEAAVTATQAALHATDGEDTLCCGALGRAELLFRAAPFLRRPELADDARRALGSVLARAHQASQGQGLRVAQMLRPGLFQGLAGTGLALLGARANGERLRVLMFE